MATTSVSYGTKHMEIDEALRYLAETSIECRAGWRDGGFHSLHETVLDPTDICPRIAEAAERVRQAMDRR